MFRLKSTTLTIFTVNNSKYWIVLLDCLRCNKYDTKLIKLKAIWYLKQKWKVSPVFCVLFRIYCEDKNSFLQDCEDDGETAAGGRLLHLLQVNLPSVLCESRLVHWMSLGYGENICLFSLLESLGMRRNQLLTLVPFQTRLTFFFLWRNRVKNVYVGFLSMQNKTKKNGSRGSS